MLHKCRKPWQAKGPSNLVKQARVVGDGATEQTQTETGRPDHAAVCQVWGIEGQA